MNYVLLPASPEDAPFLANLFREVRLPEFAPLGLPEPALAQLLSMQLRAQSMGYAAQFPNAQDQIIWIGPERAGRLLVDRSNDVMQLVDIALLASYRNQGIGKKLLDDLCEESRNKRMPLRLSVRFGNPAEHLYRRAGFVSTGGDGLNISMELRDASDNDAMSATDAEALEGDGPVEQGYTGRYFRTLAGQTLTARGADGTVIELTLQDVQAMKASRHGAPVEVDDSFILNFRGPLNPVLPAANVEFVPSGAAPMNIFIVPLGPDQGMMRYEAIFNRMMPR